VAMRLVFIEEGSVWILVSENKEREWDDFSFISSWFIAWWKTDGWTRFIVPRISDVEQERLSINEELIVLLRDAS
jgi:hypothetical protein